MMHRVCALLILPFLLIPLQTTLAKEPSPTTIVIIGASEHNAQKQHLAQRLGIPLETYRATTSATFTVYHASGDPLEAAAVLDENFIESVEIRDTNRTTVVASLSTSDMSLYELNLFHEIVDAIVGGVAIVEFGNTSPQTTSVARNSAFCWARTKFELLVPNRVLLCNGIDFEDLRPLISRNSLVPDTPEFVENPSAPQRSFLPCFFASATHTEQQKERSAPSSGQRKVRKSRKTIQPHGHRKLLQLRHHRRFGKKIDKLRQSQERFHAMTTREKKLACRYRKSCYKTGQLPQLEFYSAKLESAVAAAKVVDEEEEALIDAEEINDLEVKVLCKYRPSCYAEIGLDMSEANRQKSVGSLLTARAAAPGQKIKKRRTLKEVAQIALRKVEEQEKQSQQKQVPKRISVVERKLTELDEKLKKKIACRYRKSCYETGNVPEVNVEVPGYDFFSGLGTSTSAKIFGKHEEPKEFQDMEEDERKVYCKYRKSCYETGVVPEIEEEERFRYDDIIEMDEVPMQVRCKYRKSCYDTGIVPEPKAVQEQKLKQEAEKPLTKSIPMTLDHLRLMCKYRKSCYAENAKEEEEAKNEKGPEAPRPEEVEPEPARKSRKAPEQKEKEPPVPQKEKQTKSAKKNVKKEAEEVKKSKPKKTVPMEEKIVEELVKKPVKGKKSKDVVEEKPEEEPVQEKKEEVVVQAVKKGKKKTAKEEKPVEEPAKAVLKEVSPEEPAKPPKPSKSAKKPQKKVVKKPEAESAEDEDKTSCRYRKSCYESGVVPDAETEYTLLGGIQHFLADLYAKAMEEDDQEQPEIQKWKDKKLEQRKVDCRYRKSCYDSGILPELERQTFDTVIESIRESGDSLQQRCKYRKSCYAKEGFSEEEPPRRQVKSKPKQVVPVIRREEAAKEPTTHCKGKHCLKHQKARDEKVSEEGDEEKEVKSKPKSRKSPKKSEDDEENMKEIPRPESDHRNLSVSEKLHCKYRTSCYGTGELIMITPGGQRVKLPAGHKCKSRSSIYYHSCRELLGLPPKEKAPIGPDGRKLCRKKKPTDAY